MNPLRKMVECKKAQPKEVMLPVQLNKNRAAAARNLYGLAPEQLLAYATYMPRLTNPYGPPGILYPPFNGYGPPHAPPPHHSFGMSPSGRSSVSNPNLLSHPHQHPHHNNNNGPPLGAHQMHPHHHPSIMNPHDLAAVRMAAQQAAVFDAAFAYASGAIGTNSSGGDFTGGGTFHHHGQTSGGAQHMQQQQQQAFQQQQPNTSYQQPPAYK